MKRCLLRAGWSVKRAEAGQSLAEFALVLPILLALVIGIFEFGRAWNVYQVLTNATREGARLAIVPSTQSEDDVHERIQDYLRRTALDTDSGTITVEGFHSGAGLPVSVQVEYPYEFQFLGPIVAFLGEGSGTPGSIILSATAVMRNE
jgi:Flp pilus assembly protein TadG